MTDYQSLIDNAEQKCLDFWKRGPKRTKWTSLPPQVGDIAPDIRLTNQVGNAVSGGTSGAAVAWIGQKG
jgi:hypothetical protein